MIEKIYEFKKKNLCKLKCDEGYLLPLPYNEHLDQVGLLCAPV